MNLIGVRKCNEKRRFRQVTQDRFRFIVLFSFFGLCTNVFDITVCLPVMSGMHMCPVFN